MRKSERQALAVIHANHREEQIWAAVLALPEGERAGYLARACEDEQSLHTRLQNLLRIVGSAQVARPTAIGDCIDDYQLLEQIGEGACAAVYRAEQLAPVRREVALKVIKIGMDSKPVMSRFAAERRVLALMDHPNIAKLLDAGATGNGRPYFVMELVRGITITEYCNQMRLSIRDRVTLFMQVCRAIQHAHHQGIVHRDIKPSNVLVTLIDGVPIVKVIDFGIAKALQGRLSEETLLTAMEQFVGTPAYVSPEQTTPGSASVDTRSDIYSLGVLLYELLTNLLPFDSESTSGVGVINLRERIRSEEPVSPSKRLASLSLGELTATAGLRRTTASKLLHAVQGDLDWVALRCLEKEQAQRYQTMCDLLSELHRYVGGEPVVRTPRRLIHTLVKLANRHRIVSTPATMAVFALAIATLSLILMEVHLTELNRVAQSQNDLLRVAVVAQASRAFKGPGVRDSYGQDVSSFLALREVIPSEQGRAYLPLTQASVHQTLASTYRSVGDSVNERVQFEKALLIYRRERERTIDSRAIEASVGSASEPGLASSETTVGTEQPSKRVALATALAFVLYKLGKFTDAKALLEPELESAKDRRDEHGNVDRLALEMMAISAAIYAVEGDHARAEAFAETVLDTRRRVLGPKHWDTQSAMYLISDVHARIGKAALAANELLAATTFEYKAFGQQPRTRCLLQPGLSREPARPLFAESVLAERDFDVVNAQPMPDGSSCTSEATAQ